jgi:hypothetical protein
VHVIAADAQGELSAHMAKIASDTDPASKLLDYVRRVNVRAKELQTCGTHLSKVSTDTARKARKGVLEAVTRLLAFEQLLAKRMKGPRAAG